ncbi:hypothetical protein V8E54_010290 [Elaphomyces granulatus]
MGDGNQIPLTANVLGTIGTVMWCIQLVPQIWHNWKCKKTEGLPASMMLIWAFSQCIHPGRSVETTVKPADLDRCPQGAVPFGIYMILQRVNIPLQIQPQLFGFLTLISWGQVLLYSHNYSLVKVIMVVAGACLLCGSIEALFIFTLRIPYDKGVTWPALLIGVIAAILLVLGLIPPYFELWKRDGRVVGFSWVFLSIDCLGALFSILALAAQSSFDILGSILYIGVIVLEAGIFASHIIWRIRHRKLLRAAKEAGKTVDEMLESMEGERSTNSPPGDLESGGELDSQHQEKSSPKPGD